METSVRTTVTANTVVGLQTVTFSGVEKLFSVWRPPRVPLAPPVNGTFTTSTTGGTLAANTYWYQITALNTSGESLGSQETSITTSGSTSTVTLVWSNVIGASGYNVYGRTKGNELFLIKISGAKQWIDTGSLTPAGAIPVLNTTAGISPVVILRETLFEDVRGWLMHLDPPDKYAVQNMGANSVTIILDVLPKSVYTISADAERNLATLSGNDIPNFAEAYHDVLIYGAMATELEKMEKYQLAQLQTQRYEERLSSLRMFIAKNAYMDIYQGKGKSLLERNKSRYSSAWD